jgi:guanylate kinase
MFERGEFLEHAEVFGHRYGTPAGPVEAALGTGRDVLFDIDWQGTQQLAQAAGDDLISTFILPPSTAVLRRRLEARAQDSPEVVATRMAKAAEEMSHWREYDYIVVNHDVEQTVAEVRAILTAERLRRDRQTGLTDFVAGLRGPR